MADLIVHTHEIKERILLVEVTTWSSRHLTRSLCVECLSRSKTNKEYIRYTSIPSISQARECSHCHAMTLFMASLTYDLPRTTILKLAEKGETLDLPHMGVRVSFTVDKTLLSTYRISLQKGF